MSEDKEVQVTVKKRRGRPPKKKSIDVAEKKTEPKKETVAKKKEDHKARTPKEKKSKPTRKGFFNHLLTMLITAGIVGGGIYFWQKTSGEEMVNKIKSEARDARLDLDNKMKIIKDKLKNTEFTNNELKTVNEKLKNKANLLDGAIKVFEDTNLNYSFDYPAVFGKSDYKLSEGETGTIFRGKFTENSNLIYGGAASLVFGTSTSVNTILNTKGFTKEEDNYFFTSDGGEKLEFKPTEVLTTRSGAEVAILNKGSFKIDAGEPEVSEKEINDRVVEEDSEENAYTEATKNEDQIEMTATIFQDIESEKTVAAIISLNDDKFKGIVFLNRNTDELSLQDFKAILESVEIK